MKKHWATLIGLVLLLASHSAFSYDKVTLQLKWFNAFQFAGYYAAKEKGFYKEAGLDVDIIEGAPHINLIEKLTSGAAQFGVGTSSLLLERAAGKPVTVLAVIFQHSPLGLVAAQQEPLQNIHDLVGKRVMIEPLSDEIMAYLKRERIESSHFQHVAHSARIDDLISGKVDAATVYTTQEPYFLDKANFSYQIYTPRSLDIDFYGDNLFTTEHEIETNPQRVEAFRSASLRGWAYAMKNPDEIIDLILSKYNNPHISRELLRYEANAMAKLIRPDFVEIGYMSEARWRHIANIYKELNLLPAEFDPSKIIFDPQRNKIDFQKIQPYLLGSLLAALVLAMVAWHIFRINQKLTHSVEQLSIASNELSVSEARYRLLAAHVTEVIWTIDLNGIITYISPSIEKLIGLTANEIINKPIQNLLSYSSAERIDLELRAAEKAIKQERPISVFRDDLEHNRKDGSTVWTEVTLTPMNNAQGEFAGLLGVARDVTQRRLTEKHIRHLAHHDALTNLPNRTLFSEHIKNIIQNDPFHQQKFAIVFIDLDHFKPINDEYGHDVGDLVLKTAAQRIRSCIKKSDILARIGGDEFILLVKDVTEPALIKALADSIGYTLEQPFFEKNYELSISASLGIALYPEHGTTELDITKSADIAMYMVKRDGRNGYMFFDPAWPAEHYQAFNKRRT